MGTLDIATLATGLWENAQKQSEANSDRTTLIYNETLPPDGVYKPGEGSRGPGTFFTNGQPPNYE